MTDQRMDDQQMEGRLRAAGERFRAGNPGTDVPADVADATDVTPIVPHRRSRYLLVAAAAAVVVLVVGLTLALRGSTHAPPPPSVDNAGLQGNVWLVSNDGRPSTAALYISRTGELVADDDCRLIGAKTRVVGGRLTLSDVTVRLKACTDQYGPGFYDKGTRVLRGPASFRIDSKGMTITRPGVGSLRFVLAQTPIPPPSLDVPTLTGTDWVAPNGKVLHIDPTTGQLSGGYCSGRAVVRATGVHFVGCAQFSPATYQALLSGATLTLQRVPLDLGPPDPRRDLRFTWQSLDASIIDPASLTGRTWHLQTVNGSPASSGSLSIDGSQAVVDDGCTTYRRSVTVGTGTFTISGGGPAHACSDQATTADSFLFARPATWTVRDGNLIVYGGGSQAFAAVYGAATPQSSNSALEGVTWTVPHWGVYLVVQSDGTARLSDGCFIGTYQVQVVGDRLTVGKMLVGGGCMRPYFPPAMLRHEARYNQMLKHGAVTWAVSGNTLTLTKPGRRPLTLTTAGSSAPTLVGTDWMLSRISGGSSGEAPIVDTRAHLSIEPNGQLRAGDQCNEVSAVAHVEQSTFTLGQVARTGRHCAGLLATGTHLIDSMLAGTVGYEIEGNELVLSNPNHSTLVTYERSAGQDDPSRLAGVTWRLLSTQRGSTPSQTVGSVQFTFPDPHTLSIKRCYTSGSAIRLGKGTIVIRHLHVTEALPCPSGLPGTQAQNDFIDRVMTGQVLWSIVGDTLRIANPTVGVLTFGH